MTITVSGLGSGLNYESWIEELVALKQKKIDAVSTQASSVKSQESALSSIESDYENLLSAIEKFTSSLSSSDVFNQKSASSSSDAVTATASYKASVGNLSVSVSQLATATQAESTYSVASNVSASTSLGSLSDGDFKAGTFTLYVNGEAHTLTLNSTDTMQTVLDQINGNGTTTGITGITADLTGGELTISAKSGYTLSVGSSSDTSNFSDVMSLTRNTTTGDYSSSKVLFDTNTTTAITGTTFADSSGTATKVTKGTFYIGDTEFTIDDNTSLDDIIDNINKSTTAGVTASWDANAGKLVLTADDEGAVSIDVDAGTSNFTDVMGLTSSSWTTTTSTDGTSTTTTVALSSTKLITDSQKLGTNAILTVNGTTITSSSNTVTSDISGVKGLTLTLNTTTSSAAKVAVTQNTTTIVSAVTSLVSAFNTAISDTDKATATNGYLYGESILNSLRNKVRNLVTSAISGGTGYSTLASIGITTGAIGSSKDADTNELTLDTDALATALQNNADAVKTLLVGDGSSSSSGILDKIKTVLDNATDSTKGYFVTREKSYEKKVSNLDDKIEKMKTSLEHYQSQLETKFEAMDKLISSLESSSSVFDSYFKKSSSSS